MKSVKSTPGDEEKEERMECESMKSRGDGRCLLLLLLLVTAKLLWESDTPGEPQRRWHRCSRLHDEGPQIRRE